MKPFLCIDVTENKNAGTINGEEFLVESLSSAANDPDPAEDIPENGTDNSEEEVVEINDFKGLPPQKIENPLPFPLRVVKFVSGLLCLFLAFVLIRIYRTSQNLFGDLIPPPVIIALAIAFLVLWMALNVIEGSLIEKSAADEEEEDGNDPSDISDSLDVPEDAENVDLLAFNYTVTDGDITPVTSDEDAISEYFNCSMSLFADEERIYLASLDEKYAFDRSAITAIRTVNESISLPDWNKDVSPTSGIYKKYGLSVDNLDRITVSRYHILEVERDGEAWGVYFPSYELPIFERITGLKAE